MIMEAIDYAKLVDDEMEEMMRLLEELRLKLRSNDAGRLLMQGDY